MKYTFVTLFLVTLTFGLQATPPNWNCEGNNQRLIPGNYSQQIKYLNQQINNALVQNDQEQYVRVLLCLSSLKIRAGEVLSGIDSLNKAYQVTLDHDLEQLLPLIELAYARGCLLSNDLQKASLHFSRAAGQYLALKDSAGYAMILQQAGETAFLAGQFGTAFTCYSLSSRFSTSRDAYRTLTGLIRTAIIQGDTTQAQQLLATFHEVPVTGMDTVFWLFLQAEWNAVRGDSIQALTWLDALDRIHAFYPDMALAFSQNRQRVLAGCGRYQDAIHEGERYQLKLDSLSASGYTLSIQKKLNEAEAYYISLRLNHDQDIFSRWSSRVNTLTSYVVLLTILVVATLVTLGFLLYSWSRKRDEAVQLRNTGLHQMAELHRSNRHLKEFGRLSGQALKGYLLDLKTRVENVNREAITSDHNRMVFGLVETALSKLERLLGELDDILRFPDPRSLPSEKIRLDTQFIKMLDSWDGDTAFPDFKTNALQPVVALGPRQYILSILQNTGLFIREYYRQHGGSDMTVLTAHEGDAAILTFMFHSNRPFDQPEMLFRFRSRVYDTTDPYTIYIYIAYMLTRSIGGDLRVTNVKDRNVLSLILPFETITQDEAHSLQEED